MKDAESRNISGLCELLARVKDGIMDAVPSPEWVRAEISEIKNHPSGHCYLTLVETDGSGRMTAKVSAVIWASSYKIIRPYFESETGQGLGVGMNVLLRVQVQFSELYSLSLIVSDIDPAFTLGEMERQRRKTIARLEEEGMMDMNASLVLPQLPRRFAVITAETAAGYRDFMKQLHGNEYGFRFETTIFPAVMQGKDAPQSIISAMEAVAERAGDFDALLMMRGGGGAMDLICFDDYDLAVNVAQFPLPVLTGIGHDHDYHIVDMVAFANVKTPTALADFIVDLFSQEDYRIETLATRLKMALKDKAARDIAVFDAMAQRLAHAVARRRDDALNALDRMELRISAADPQAALGRGYSIVLKNGRKVNSLSDLMTGDSVTLMLRDGIVEATVKKVRTDSKD